MNEWDKETGKYKSKLVALLQITLIEAMFNYKL